MPESNERIQVDILDYLVDAPQPLLPIYKALFYTCGHKELSLEQFIQEIAALVERRHITCTRYSASEKQVATVEPLDVPAVVAQYRAYLPTVDLSTISYDELEYSIAITRAGRQWWDNVAPRYHGPPERENDFSVVDENFDQKRVVIRGERQATVEQRFAAWKKDNATAMIIPSTLVQAPLPWYETSTYQTIRNGYQISFQYEITDVDPRNTGYPR